MAILTRNALKNLFRTAMKPFQADYWNWMDSYWHKQDDIPVSSVENLTTILNNIPYGVYRGVFNGGTLDVPFADALLVTIVTMESAAVCTINVGIAGEELEEKELAVNVIRPHTINSFLNVGQFVRFEGAVTEPVKFSIYQMKYATV